MTITVRSVARRASLAATLTAMLASMLTAALAATACQPATGTKPDSRAAEPDLSQGDAVFLPGLAPQLEVKRAPTGHLLVRPVVNGVQPGWFIFDTGAGICVISTPHLAEFKLAKAGAIEATGVGGSSSRALYRADTLVLGPLSLRNHPVMATDLSFLQRFLKDDIVGIIGYGVLSRCVAELDPAAPAIALFDRGTYTPADGTWSTLTLLNRVPALTATYEGHQGLFRVDTGSNESVTIHQAAVRKHDLLNGRPNLASAKMGGVGGFVSAKKGTLATFALAGTDLGEVPATFSLATSGSMADSDLDGTIGSGILDRFRLVFDYAGERAILIPHPRTDPIITPRSDHP